LAVGVVGKTDTPRISNPFEARCNIDAVAHHVTIAFRDHIAEMNADAELDATPRSCRSAPAGRWWDRSDRCGAPSIHQRVYAVKTGAVGPEPTPDTSALEKQGAPRLSIVVLSFALRRKLEQQVLLAEAADKLYADRYAGLRPGERDTRRTLRSTPWCDAAAR